MQKHGAKEHFVGGVEQLPQFENDGGPNGEQEDDHVVEETHAQNGQDVEFVGGKVVVQNISLFAVRHHESVTANLYVQYKHLKSF